MQARTLPLQRGWAWLQEGLLLWRRNPAVLIFASFTFILILVIVSSIPLIGQPIASLIMPVLSLGVLNTCRAVDEGRKTGPEIILSGFSSKALPALITIGGIYLVGNLLVLVLTSLLDGGTLMRLMTGIDKLDPEGPMPDMRLTLFIAITLSTPVLMAYWFAAVLAGWWRQPAPKAMFFSFYACLQNWRPFLAYGVAVVVFGFLVPSLIIGMAGMIAPMLSSLLLISLPLLLLPVLFASFYANAKDVFGTQTHDRITL